MKSQIYHLLLWILVVCHDIWSQEGKKMIVLVEYQMLT